MYTLVYVGLSGSVQTMATRDNDRKKLSTLKGKEGRERGREKSLFITHYSQVFNSPNTHFMNVYQGSHKFQVHVEAGGLRGKLWGSRHSHSHSPPQPATAIGWLFTQSMKQQSPRLKEGML